MRNQACCSCCTCVGWGHNCFCYGGNCCSPDYLKDYSAFMNGEGSNVILINQQNQGYVIQNQPYW